MAGLVTGVGRVGGMGLGVGFGGRGRGDGLAAASLGNGFEAFEFHSKVSVRDIGRTERIGATDERLREDRVQNQAVILQYLRLAD